LVSEAESKEKWCMGPYAVVDYNLTLSSGKPQCRKLAGGEGEGLGCSQ
jgi:hypothetical protein